jgi:hypothetical protein
MNTQPARVDANQPEIVRALRQVGATVQHLHTVGHGCPDLLVARNGNMYLLEIKVGGARLTDDERKWHECWAAHVYVVRSIGEALAAIGAAEYTIGGER